MITDFITNALGNKEKINLSEKTKKCSLLIFFIKKLLKEKQAYYVKFFGCGITTAGTPDILACVNGHFLGIECKTDNGRLSEMQRLKLKAIQNCFFFPHRSKLGLIA